MATSYMNDQRVLIFGTIPYGVPTADGRDRPFLLRPGCFDGGWTEEDDVRLVIEHDPAREICTSSDFLEIKPTSAGLRWSADLPVCRASLELKAAVEDGRLGECSVQFWSIQEPRVRDGRLVNEVQEVVELIDVSLCRSGAFPGANAFAMIDRPVSQARNQSRSSRPTAGRGHNRLKKYERLMANCDAMQRAKQMVRSGQIQLRMV